MSEAVTIAPALTIGLSGHPSSSRSSKAEKEPPVGSTPVREVTMFRPAVASACPNTSGFEADWRVNCVCWSPTMYWVPSTRVMAMQYPSGSALESSGM